MVHFVKASWPPLDFTVMMSHTPICQVYKINGDYAMQHHALSQYYMVATVNHEYFVSKIFPVINFHVK